MYLLSHLSSHFVVVGFVVVVVVGFFETKMSNPKKQNFFSFDKVPKKTKRFMGFLLFYFVCF